VLGAGFIGFAMLIYESDEHSSIKCRTLEQTRRCAVLHFSAHGRTSAQVPKSLIKKVTSFAGHSVQNSFEIRCQIKCISDLIRQRTFRIVNKDAIVVNVWRIYYLLFFGRSTWARSDNFSNSNWTLIGPILSETQ
jgi:hypothetical protein